MKDIKNLTDDEKASLGSLLELVGPYMDLYDTETFLRGMVALTAGTISTQYNPGEREAMVDWAARSTHLLVFEPVAE